MGNPDLLLGLLGAALCLFGFSLYMGGLKVVGMFLGGSFGALVGLIIAYVGRLQETNRPAVLIIALAGFLVGAALGWRFLRALNRFIIILIGAGLGYVLGRLLASSDLGGIWSQPWMPFAMALAGGVAAALLYRYIIIIATAALGSYLLFQSTGKAWVMVLAFVLGLAIQAGLFHGLGLRTRTHRHD
jgi:hypothetical protein